MKNQQLILFSSLISGDCKGNKRMNPLKAVYCRAFQLGFKLALPLLPYREPKILKNMEEVAETLKKKKIGSVLLVTDQGIRGCGLTAHLEKVLREQGIDCPVFDGTVPNPTIDNIEEARALYLEHSCGALIGFGGGSSIDCAKAVGARIARPNKNVRQMRGILKVGKKIPPLFAIPTTAGTGSETTLAAVITNPENQHKYPINDFVLIPHYAVLDPLVTLGLPQQLTATTGMDAMTHAVEAFIGRSTTGKTRRYAKKAVKWIYENIETVYTDGLNERARRKMLYASFLAGESFSISYVGYVHAIAHSLGGQYGTPHGLANAVILPYFLDHYGKTIDKKLAILAKNAGMADKDQSIAEAA